MNTEEATHTGTEKEETLNDICIIVKKDLEEAIEKARRLIGRNNPFLQNEPVDYAEKSKQAASERPVLDNLYEVLIRIREHAQLIAYLIDEINNRIE